METSKIRRGIERVFADTIDDLIDEYLKPYPYCDSSTARAVLTGFATWLKREVGCHTEDDGGPAEVRDETG